MAKRLFVVADVFTIFHFGRGLTPEPRLGPGQVHVGDAIELRRPDGTSATTTIKATGSYPLVFVIPLEIAAEEIPPGTEAWT
ncbi:MAG TPA: hypothetical protein VF590_27730 [Isosphaeraceae bacterium]